mmetsp:Transcript_30501/g.57113  ORF Transcript_30501/g.57113 Transcript_30501/m.57113 type:complete len:151 (+) Transcript_30501:76-528(+)
MRARLYLQAVLAWIGLASGFLRGSSQAPEPALAQESVTQLAEKTQRRPESIAANLIAPDFPPREKASNPYQVETATGNVTYSNDLGPQTPAEPDSSVGLKPLFVCFVAAIFFSLLVAVCLIVPNLPHVTLGIAGNLEKQFSHPEVVKSGD